METTLKSTKELIDFFERTPKLTFDQMTKIIGTFADGDFTVITFKNVDKQGRLNESKTKKELLAWMAENAGRLDGGKPCCFFVRMD